MEQAAADRRSAPIRRRARRATPLLATVCVVLVAGCSSTTKSVATSTTAAGGVTTVAGAPGTTTSGATTTGSTTAPASTPTTIARTTVTPTTISTTTTLPATTTLPSTTTSTVPPTTTLPLMTQGGVVLVANASGIDGAAAAVANTLSGLGFQTVKATNAAGYEDSLDVSKVYFAPEAYGVAYSIAQLMGGVVVAPMPTPPPIVLALDGLRGANVIVMLGKDLAGQPLPGDP